MSSAPSSSDTNRRWLDEVAGVGYLCPQVMSLSVKPRLAEQQPSDRGGVLRVRTGSIIDKRGLAQQGPQVEVDVMCCCRMSGVAGA